MSVADGMAAVDSAAATITKADHEAALATAREEGRKAGLEAGEKAGFTKGHAEGLATGKTEGKADGETVGRAAGAAAERDRIAGIESISGIKGHEKLIADAKADGKSTKAEVAVAIIEAEQAKGGTILANLKADGAAGAAAAPLAQPANTKKSDSEALLADATQSVEERCKAAFDTDPALRAEFGTLGALVAWQKAADSGQAKVYRPRAH